MLSGLIDCQKVKIPSLIDHVSRMGALLRFIYFEISGLARDVVRREQLDDGSARDKPLFPARWCHEYSGTERFMALGRFRSDNEKPPTA